MLTEAQIKEKLVKLADAAIDAHLFALTLDRAAAPPEEVRHADAVAKAKTMGVDLIAQFLEI